MNPGLSISKKGSQWHWLFGMIRSAHLPMHQHVDCRGNLSAHRTTAVTLSAHATDTHIRNRYTNTPQAQKFDHSLCFWLLCACLLACLLMYAQATTCVYMNQAHALQSLSTLAQVINSLHKALLKSQSLLDIIHHHACITTQAYMMESDTTGQHPYYSNCACRVGAMSVPFSMLMVDACSCR